MKKRRRTRVIDWLICFAVLAVALLFLSVGVYGRLYGTTPEAELIGATGVARDARVSSVSGNHGQTTDFLWFTVGGHRVSYASDQDGYDRVVQAVRSGTALTIRVSTKQETLFPRRGWVPLYSLSIDDDELLSYQETITKGYRGSNAPYIVGGALGAVSLFGLTGCFRNRKVPVV